MAQFFDENFYSFTTNYRIYEPIELTWFPERTNEQLIFLNFTYDPTGVLENSDLVIATKKNIDLEGLYTRT
jgi:hypothetical protein